MNHTREEIQKMHETLYRLCELPALPLGMAEINRWNDFLFGMESLEGTPGGKLTVADIIGVISRMKDDIKRKKAGWALRPSTMMKNPDVFIELVMEARKVLRVRPPAQPTSRTVAGTSIRIEGDERSLPDPDHVSKEVEAFKARLKGNTHVN